VSGDAVILAAERDSLPYRAVASLLDVGSGLPAFALIGGLAVIARLGQAHRATNDIDTVSDDQVGLLDALVASGLDRRGDSIQLDAQLKPSRSAKATPTTCPMRRTGSRSTPARPSRSPCGPASGARWSR
jgi:hypothetical protein